MIFGNGNTLEVRPLRRYRTPRYPRAGEPLAFSIDDLRTWPFPSAVAAVMLAAAGASGCEAAPGAVGSLADTDRPVAEVTVSARAPAAILAPTVPTASVSFEPLETVPMQVAECSHDCESFDDTLEPVSPPPQSTENPFTWAKSELPPPMIWGKGSPSVLPSEVAVAAVRGAFEDRGVPMTADVGYDEGGVALELDGLHEPTTVGFEWITWGYEEDEESLTTEEMVRLDKDMTAGERHIAVINAFDPRFSYGSPIVETHDTQEQALEELVGSVHQFVDFLEQEGVL